MWFINEFVSDEDIEKYNLYELWNKYNKYASARMPEQRLKFGYDIYWTIDRELDSWLIMIEQVRSIQYTDHPIDTNEYVFILFLNGKNIEVRLSKSPESSVNSLCQPYYIVWDLKSIKPIELPNSTIEDTMSIFKKAMVTLGLDGANRQINNTVVKFNF